MVEVVCVDRGLHFPMRLQGLTLSFLIFVGEWVVQQEGWISNTLLGIFWSIVSENPSDSESIWLHVHIFRFWFIHLSYILCSPSKWSVTPLLSGTWPSLTSNSTGTLSYYPLVHPQHGTVTKALTTREERQWNGWIALVQMSKWLPHERK
jgi:hypothetical protein